MVQDGQTPLHSAAQMGNVAALELLLAGAETDPFAVDLQVGVDVMMHVHVYF